MDKYHSNQRTIQHATINHDNKPFSKASSRVSVPRTLAGDSDYYTAGHQPKQEAGERQNLRSGAVSLRGSFKGGSRASQSNEAMDQMMRTSMPRILNADERTRFVKALRTQNYESDELKAMSTTLRSKLQDMLKIQQDEEYLKQVMLPKLPKNQYAGPLIVSAARPGENSYVITNDSHSRHTNNGFQRNALGGFYEH